MMGSLYYYAQECTLCTDVKTSKVLYPVLPCFLFPVLMVALYIFNIKSLGTWSGWRQGVAQRPLMRRGTGVVACTLGGLGSLPLTPYPLH